MLQSTVKGWMGEMKTRFAQTLFLDLKQYHVFNNIYIKIETRTVQIDHIIVSRYGVFVIETKDKDGWIYGDKNDKQWTQVFPNKKKFRFQNPLKQNYLHTKSLSEVLGIEHGKIHSVVVFWGKCEFKKEMPENVLKSECTGYIKSKKQILLEDEEVDRICRQLKHIKDNTSLLAGWHHTRDLKKRFGSTVN